MPRAQTLLYVGIAAFILLASGLVAASSVTSTSAAHPSTGGGWGYRAGMTYNMTFSETGLPSGTNWSVGVSPAWGTWSGWLSSAGWGWHPSGFQVSNTTSLNFSLPNGTYTYHAEASLGFTSNSSRGTFTVNGSSPPSINITFYPRTTYVVTFAESGLAAGTTWSVQLGGGWGGFGYGGWHRGGFESSNGTLLNVTVLNGTYFYRAEAPSGYTTSDGRGLVNVSGASPPVINITFTPLSTYSVTFAEMGLPVGTNWTVTVFGHGDGWNGARGSHAQVQTSNNSTLSFLLENGTYAYRVSAVSGFVTNASRGGFEVAGAAAATINVSFSPFVAYSVAFNETGLPGGTNWSVRVFGLASEGVGWYLANATSSTSNLSLNLPNGTYVYQIGWIPGWQVTVGNWSGTFNVSGSSPPEISVVFTATNSSSWSPLAPSAGGVSLGQDAMALGSTGVASRAT